MKLLHTADWHIGKTLKGRNRLDEQRQVIAQIIAVAREHEPDAVLIAGDLYDMSAPSAEAQQLVVQALLALEATGAQIIAIAGNHDSAATFDAYRPLMGAAGITLVGSVRMADKGGVVSFDARSTGERVNVAVLPFLSQRYAVRAAQLIASTPSEMSRDYDDMVREVIANLAQSFTPDAVNVVMAHLTVTGGTLGGGERAAQSIFEYNVPASAFPAEAHYVALGHLHRRQTLPAPCPVVYSGSPFAVDFGEQDNTQVVCLVEATPTTPAKITDIPITAGPPPADGARDRCRIGRPGRRVRRRLPPRLCSGTHQCRAPRIHHRRLAERLGGADRPGVCCGGEPGPTDGQPVRPIPRRAVRRILRLGWLLGHQGPGAVRAAARSDHHVRFVGLRDGHATGAAGHGRLRVVP